MPLVDVRTTWTIVYGVDPLGTNENLLLQLNRTKRKAPCRPLPSWSPQPPLAKPQRPLHGRGFRNYCTPHPYLAHTDRYLFPSHCLCCSTDVPRTAWQALPFRRHEPRIVELTVTVLCTGGGVAVLLHRLACSVRTLGMISKATAYRPSTQLPALQHSRILGIRGVLLFSILGF